MVYNLELSTIICFIKENEYALIMNIKKPRIVKNIKKIIEHWCDSTPSGSTIIWCDLASLLRAVSAAIEERSLFQVKFEIIARHTQ